MVCLFVDEPWVRLIRLDLGDATAEQVFQDRKGVCEEERLRLVEANASKVYELISLFSLLI